MDEQEFQDHYPEKREEQNSQNHLVENGKDLYWHNPPHSPYSSRFFRYPPTDPNDPRARQAFTEILQLLQNEGFTPRAAYLKWLHDTTLTRSYEELRIVNQTTENELDNIERKRQHIEEKLIQLHVERARLYKKQRELTNGTSPHLESSEESEEDVMESAVEPSAVSSSPSEESLSLKDRASETLHKNRETWLQKEREWLETEIQKKEQQLEEALQKREALLREEIQEAQREIQENQEELRKLKTERDETEKRLHEALAKSPLLLRKIKSEKTPPALEEALWKWSPSQEALAGQSFLEPPESPFMPFGDRAPSRLRIWRGVKSWFTHPLVRLATNLLGPIGAGFILGINISVLTGLVSIHEFRRGEMLWLFLLAMGVGL